MTITDFFHHVLIKPALAGGLVYAGNSILMNETNMKRNAVFAGTVFGALVVADVLATYALPKTNFQTLEGKVMEVSFGVGSVYVLDHVLKNPINKQMERYAMVVGAEVLADYLKDVLLNSGM